MNDFPLPRPFQTCIFVAPHKEGARRVDIISAQELINRYPDSAPELANVNMPYPTFGSEALALLALGEQKDIPERLEACGLRKQAWTELSAAHRDFVSAQ